jgi:hypothetical protein
MGDTQNSAKQRGRPFQKDDPRINKGGRPADYGKFRELCRTKSPAAVQALEAALSEGGAAAVAAARVLLEYGYGKPSSAPEDLEAVREGGVSLSVLTRDELLKIAKGEEP